MKWTIGAKLYTLSGAGLLLFVVLTALAWWSMTQVNGALREIVLTCTALRNHLEARLAQEALRTDVFTAVLSDTDAEERKRIAADASDHAKGLQRSLSQNQELTLSTKVHTGVNDVKPLADAYAKAAQDLLALPDRSAMMPKVGGFVQAGEDLRGRMDNLTGLMEKSVNQSQAAGDETLATIGRTISILVVIAVFITGLTMWLTRGVVRSLAQTVLEMATTSQSASALSQQMAGFAEDTSSQANSVSGAADQVSKNIQAVASGAEEMSASIKEIGKNTTEGAKAATSAVTVADATNTTIAKLGQSSAEIGKVVKVITSIAQQTNLLALNATIEAARAGEAGKGFVVVANEVKELAKQTAAATEEIGQKIAMIQSDTAKAVEAIGQISGIIKELNGIQNAIAVAIEEQMVTTNDMSRNVAEAARSIEEIAQSTTSVARTARDTAKAADNTRGSATQQAQIASRLQDLVGRDRGGAA